MFSLNRGEQVFEVDYAYQTLSMLSNSEITVTQHVKGETFTVRVSTLTYKLS